MPYLSPPTLTRVEQETLLQASSAHPRDHLIFSLALGTGLRLAELVGLNVGDVFTADGKLRGRIRLHRRRAPARTPGGGPWSRMGGVNIQLYGFYERAAIRVASAQ